MGSGFLVYNAKIYQSGLPDKSWMVISRTTGRIVQMGTDCPPVANYSSNDKQDFSGQRVLPGLHEAHIHASSVGKALASVQLQGCSSISEFQKRIKEYAQIHPLKKWIGGRHWEQDILGRYPTKLDIDEVLSDRPAVLSRACGHVVVANSLALELAGITKDTADPVGGIIDRFPNDHPLSGEPTGILRETPAYEAILDLIEYTEEERLEWMVQGVQYCLKHGVTTVQSCESGSDWPLWAQLVDNDQLPVRLFYSAYFEDIEKGKYFPKPKETHGQLLTCDRIKIFSDGALGIATARMSKPYKGDKNNYGVYIYPQEKLDSLVAKANALGYRLEIHAIGDAAADATITAIERAGVRPEKRPILTHCQILRSDLIKRMKDGGFVANIQPQFVPTDARWLGQLLHDDLLEYAYAWKTLFDTGIPCAGGSDAPVEVAQPFLGIFDAIFRPSGNRTAANLNTFKPEERLSVEQAVDLYTKNAAWACMREDELGQLAPGFFADFTVVAGDDPIENPLLFASAKPAQVWMNGQLRFENTET